MVRVLFLVLCSAFIALSHPVSAEPLRVVASFSILGDLAASVGGDRITLTTLVGPDGDTHVYEPKPADVAAVAKADVVVVNGLHLEGFLKRLLEASETRAAVVELTRGLPPLSLSPDEHPHDGADRGAVDPHAFQSVPNVRIYVRNIAEAFCTADPAGCDDYAANAEAYEQELAALDAEIRAAVASIPAQKRVIITSHDAFGYFEHEYGIVFLAPEGVSTDSEASAADVARLVEQVRQEKAAAIFMENVTIPRLIEQIAAETGLRIGETLYSDALSRPNGPAATYIDMMRNNIRAIVTAVLAS